MSTPPSLEFTDLGVDFLDPNGEGTSAPPPPPKATPPLSPRPMVITPITILAGYIINNKDLLSLSENNYNSWAQKTLRDLDMCSGISGYPLGIILRPDPSHDYASWAAWGSNDRAVHAFISQKCTEEELDFLRPFTTSSSREVWLALKERHSKTGAYSQILLVRDGLAARYSRSKPFHTLTSHLHDLALHIVEMGPIETNTLWLMFMVNAMQGELHDVQSLVISGMTDTSSYSPAKCVARLNWEAKRIAESSASTGSGTSLDPSRDAQVLVASGSRQCSASKKFCSHCKQSGHLADTCFAPGGAMEGKKNEVLARKRAEREARRSKTPSMSSGNAGGGNAGTVVHKYTDPSGRAFIIDNGAVVFLAQPSTSSATSSSSLPADTPLTALSLLSAIRPRFRLNLRALSARSSPNPSHSHFRRSVEIESALVSQVHGPCSLAL